MDHHGPPKTQTRSRTSDSATTPSEGLVSVVYLKLTINLALEEFLPGWSLWQEFRGGRAEHATDLPTILHFQDYSANFPSILHFQVSQKRFSR